MIRTYPPGFFLELVRLYDWPPGFAPQTKFDAGAQLRKEAALRGSAELRQKLAVQMPNRKVAKCSSL